MAAQDLKTPNCCPTIAPGTPYIDVTGCMWDGLKNVPDNEIWEMVQTSYMLYVWGEDIAVSKIVPPTEKNNE